MVDVSASIRTLRVPLMVQIVTPSILQLRTTSAFFSISSDLPMISQGTGNLRIGS
jgi:hypothetical protein